MQIGLNKTKRQCIAHGNYSSIASFHAKNPRYLQRYVEFLAIFRLFIYYTISRGMFCGTLAGKLCTNGLFETTVCERFTQPVN